MYIFSEAPLTSSERANVHERVRGWVDETLTDGNPTSRSSSSNVAAAATSTTTTTTTTDEEVEEGDDESVNWDPSDDMHDIGTFAQVQNIIRMPLADIDHDEKDGGGGGGGSDKSNSVGGGGGGGGGDDEEGSGGVTLLLLGHRRLRKTHTVRNEPMAGDCLDTFCNTLFLLG